MWYLFISTRIFDAKARRCRLTLDDLRAIEYEISLDPRAWPLVSGGGGLRKMRFASSRSSGGKSGGLRVCYFFIDAASHVHLLTVFAKSEMENLSAADLKLFAAIIAAIRSSYEKESS